MKGIDVAKWNPIADYGAVAQQVDFAVLKIINKSNNEDSLFNTHLNGFRAHNVPIYGVYNYSYAESIEKARTDAQAVIKALKRHELKTIVWMDVEENAIAKKLRKNLINVIEAYKSEIEGAGYTFGVYTGLSFYNTFIMPYIGSIGSINFWIARYPVSSPMLIYQDPPANKKPVIYNMMAWQYSSKGRIDGINGNVDLNITDLPAETWQQIIDGNPLNENIKPILKRGDHNEYVAAWQRMLNANGYQCGNSDGIFGQRTQDALIRYQQDHGIEAGFVGPQTWATLN